MGYKLKEINGLQNPLGSSIYKTPKQSLGYKTHERSASYDWQRGKGLSAWFYWNHKTSFVVEGF